MSLAAAFCELFSRRRSEQMSWSEQDRIEERVYKSLWHVLIAAVGIYELRTHKTKVAKALACGLIAFHVDAAIADMLDRPTLSRRILNAIRPRKDRDV